MPNIYDREMVRTLRRTVEYFGQINRRTDLTRKDKRTIKHHFLESIALPRVHTLRAKHTLAPIAHHDSSQHSSR